MNHRRSILFTLAAILMLMAFPAFLYADAVVQVEPDGQTLSTATALDEIPPLVDGAPYPYPIISYAPPAQPAASSRKPLLDRPPITWSLIGCHSAQAATVSR